MNDENQYTPKKMDEIDILKELAALDPLGDRQFKIFVSDDEQYKFLAESFSNEILNGEKIVHMNGEIVLTVGGRLIRTDTLRGADSTVFNMEAHVVTNGFPLKRHIFYTAVIYASGIQKNDQWEDLKPVISIVIYKDKDDAPLIENGAFAGDLFKTDDDRKQLTLIAVNTAKWRDAPTEELRAYLATLHHGIMTEENKANFTDVDISSEAFANVQRAVKMACAHTKKEDYDKKGDDTMSAVYATYLSKEDREAAKKEGRNEGRKEGRVEGEAKGLNLAWEIINSLRLNIPIPEIANKFKVSTSEIEKFKAVL